MFEFMTLWNSSKHKNRKTSNIVHLHNMILPLSSCALISNTILSSSLTTFITTFLSNKSALSQIPMHWFKILYLGEILNNILNLRCLPNNKKESLSLQKFLVAVEYQTAKSEIRIRILMIILSQFFLLFFLPSYSNLL